MSDRIEDALRTLDDLGPDASVLQRARKGPRRPEPSTGPSRTRRGVAAVTAFAVFAVAAGFAWRTWHAADETPARPNLTPGTVVPLGADGSTLWPEWTAAQLADAQSQADAGNWDRALDPQQVAQDFAEAVLGWGNGGYVATVLDTPATGMTVRLDQLPASCPSPLPGEEMAPICSVPPGTEEVTLAQPMTQGDGGIWAVTQVIAPTASIDAVPGLVVDSGGAITGRLEVAEGLQGATGSLITDLHGSAACSRGNSRSTDGGEVEIALRLPPDPDRGTSCGPSLPAFVWASTSIEENGVLRNVGPFLGGPSSYASLTAFPVVVALPESGSQADLTTYTDPMGWSVSYPTSWSVTPIDSDFIMVTERGAIVSNHPDILASPNVATPSPIGPNEGSSPPDLVAVRIFHTEGGPPKQGAPGPDSQFPINPSDLKQQPGPGGFDRRSITFQANGLVYELALIAGPDASESDLASADDIIRSLRPASLDPGSAERTQGFLALSEPDGGYPRGAGAAIQVEHANMVYVMRPRHGLDYVMDVVPDGCGEGEGFSWDPDSLQILITCPDGTEIRYDVDGSADPANPPQYPKHLDVLPVSESWDGRLLAFMDGDYQVPPNAWQT